MYCGLVKLNTKLILTGRSLKRHKFKFGYPHCLTEFVQAHFNYNFAAYKLKY